MALNAFAWCVIYTFFSLLSSSFDFTIPPFLLECGGFLTKGLLEEINRELKPANPSAPDNLECSIFVHLSKMTVLLFCFANLFLMINKLLLISINGISLTVAKVANNSFMISIIKSPWM